MMADKRAKDAIIAEVDFPQAQQRHFSVIAIPNRLRHDASPPIDEYSRGLKQQHPPAMIHNPNKAGRYLTGTSQFAKLG